MSWRWQNPSARPRLAIYTNNGPIVKYSLDELFPEAAAIFKERYCSYEFGTKKPDPDSFTKLLAKISVAPADTWFIDDKRSNVQGARLAGLKAHHFRSYEPLAKEARNMGFAITGNASMTMMTILAAARERKLFRQVRRSLRHECGRSEIQSRKAVPRHCQATKSKSAK